MDEHRLEHETQMSEILMIATGMDSEKTAFDGETESHGRLETQLTEPGILEGNSVGRTPDWEKALEINLPDEVFLSSKPYSEIIGHMLAALDKCCAVTQENNIPPTKIIEFCCSNDSKIGEIGHLKGVEVFRCSEESCNVQTAVGLAKVMEYARQNPGCHLHGSLPCTPWSALQALNEHQYGEAFSVKLRLAQKSSLRLVATFVALAKIVQSNGGKVSFEWPRYAKGWKEKQVQQMLVDLKLECTLIDGCTVNLRSKRTGKLIKKPWTFANDSPCMQKLMLGKRCDHPRDEHEPCEGSETKATGFYTKELATIIVLAYIQEDRKKRAEQETENRQREQKQVTWANTMTLEEKKAFMELPANERQRLIEAARKIHINTGHRPVRDLARSLRQKGAPLSSRAAMEQVKCSSCHEHSRPISTPVATFDTAHRPFEVIGIDIKETTEKDGTKLKYLIIVCEACRLTKAILLFKIAKDKHRNTTTAEAMKAYTTGWEEHFGPPRAIRHDPEGAFVSTEIIQEMSQKGIHLQATAGEAHWQLGITERTIGTVFTTAQKIRDECDITMEQAVTEAVKAQNNVDRVRGYCPSQWAFGRMPSWTGELHEQPDDVNMSRDTSEQFSQRMQTEITARKLYEEQKLTDRLQRALRAKHRKDHVFIPGEIVFAWREGTHKLSGAKKTGIKEGAWFGPATVLGTESKIHEGVALPGSIVWIVINDRLWRCAPQQLRRTSEREHAEHLLLQKKPWTFENITSGLILGQYRDITTEPYPETLPEEEQQEEPAQQMEEDAEDQPEGEDMDAENQSEEKLAGIKRPHPTGKQRYNEKKGKFQKEDVQINFTEATEAAKEAMLTSETAFFAIHEAPGTAIEIAFPFIEGERKLRKYLRNPEAFVVNSLRKQRVEVNERKLNAEDKELIRTAKGKEIKEFVREKVVEALKQGEMVNPEEVMKMRFVLTWKKNPDGTKKGKARLVVLGFQDPYLGHEQTCAPTLNKRSKQILLQVVVQNGWNLEKGDVTAAFLQGRPLTKSKYAMAPEELASELGMQPGDRVVRLLKSVYGLTAAPLEWYAQVDIVLTKLGGTRTFADPCVWTFIDSKTGLLCGIIGAHVDDFLIAGDGLPHWKKCMEALLTAFRWTPFEKTSFKQCGIQITQDSDKSIKQDQKEYLSQLGEIEVSTERAKELSSPVTESERTELRGILGGLQWLVTQSNVHSSVDVNLLQSDISTATVETLLLANKTLRKVRQGPGELFTRKIEGTMTMAAWSDASWANRKSGNSTGGYLIGLCNESVLDGERGHVSIVSWSTNKLKRVARSSMAAEMQALANAEDELHLCRLAWAEFSGQPVDVNDINKTIRAVPGTVIIDAKSIYDVLTSNNQPLQLAEKRTALELLAYLRNTELNGTTTRWTHGGANLADGLTKLGNHPMLREFLETSTWALPRGNMSGKKRAKHGVTNLENETEEFQKLAWTKLKEMWPHWGQDSDAETD